MYIMPNILCFLGGRCFYFSRSVLGTFCEEEFVFVSATYGSRDFGIVLENLSSSRFFLFILSKCYRGQTNLEPGVYNLI